ncbi:MAG TPA: hypothetical protein VFE33_07085 [Thermoanaerobaculia bacterium]|nr:hypothetical protein [Thermoanaerobaculia bacterium]
MTTKPTRSQRRPRLEGPPSQTALQPHRVSEEVLPSPAAEESHPEAEARHQFIEDGLHVAEQLRSAADAACEAAEQLHRAMGEARQVAAEARVAIHDQRRLLAEMRETLSEYERLLQGYVN